MLVQRLLVHHVAQVDQVVGKDAGPYHVDLEDIDVARFGGKQLLIKRKALIAVVRGGDELDAVARGGLPRPDPALADLELDPDGAAGNGNRRAGFRLGDGFRRGGGE